MANIGRGLLRTLFLIAAVVAAFIAGQRSVTAPVEGVPDASLLVDPPTPEPRAARVEDDRDTVSSRQSFVGSHELAGGSSVLPTPFFSSPEDRPPHALFPSDIAGVSDGPYQRRLEQLDEHILRSMTGMNSNEPIEGHSGQIPGQQRLYWAIVASNPWIRTVCEVGFNAGHSAAVFAHALLGRNATANDPDKGRNIWAFDLCEHTYTTAAWYGLRIMFRDRVHLACGDSRFSIANFRAKHPEITCDLVHVDGDHFGDAPRSDMLAFREMTARRNVVIMDDTSCVSNFCWEPQAQWDRAKSEGWVAEDGCFSFDGNRTRGACVGRFV